MKLHIAASLVEEPLLKLTHARLQAQRTIQLPLPGNPTTQQ